MNKCRLVHGGMHKDYSHMQRVYSQHILYTHFKYDFLGFRVAEEHGRKSSYGGAWLDFEQDLLIYNPYDLIVWNGEDYLGFRVVE